MTNDDIIDDVILKEGGSATTNDPSDKGGRTTYGISERANEAAWKDGVVTKEEARAIYITKYVVQPGFDQVQDEHLRHLLVDFGVLSGPGTAIKALQRALGTREDGVLGLDTLSKVNAHTDSRKIHNRVVEERVKLMGRIVQKNPSQLKWLSGWLNRSISFIR